jgi:hypothetical protein
VNCKLVFLCFFYQKLPNDIISRNFDSEKVDQDEVFYYKDTLHFFLARMTEYYTYQKLYLGLVALNKKREERGNEIRKSIWRLVLSTYTFQFFKEFTVHF